MSYASIDVASLRNYLEDTSKRAAKRLKKASPSLTHSACLDQIAAHASRDNWSLLAKHLGTAEPDSLLRIAAKLCPEFRRMNLPDHRDGEQLMRAWVLGKFTPLHDFAYFDSEAENGYAWPEVELAAELYDEFSGIYPDDMLEKVAVDLERDGGPWGLEDYERTEEDD